MRGRLLAGIFVLGWLSAGVAGASELPGRIAAMCVQGQLEALGYPVGAIDGQIGPRSIAAAERYAAESKLATVGELSAASAELWCRALAAHDPKLAVFLERAEDAADLASRSHGAADDFRYDIAANVPAGEVDLIKRGTAMAESYLVAKLGRGIPEAKRQRITIKIVATGRGNQEEGGGGAAATAFAGAKQRPFFDVAHPQWKQNTQGRGWTTQADSMKTVVHEYVHIWHGELGAISGVRQPLPGWMNEGIAEYVAYRAMVDAGLMKWADIRPFMVNGAVQDQLGTTLDKVRAWPGHVGFLAIDWLVESSPNGLASLRLVGEAVGAGRSTKAAFHDAFGLGLDDFYAQFEAWRPSVVRNPGRALATRPKLIMAN